MVCLSEKLSDKTPRNSDLSKPDKDLCNEGHRHCGATDPETAVVEKKDPLENDGGVDGLLPSESDKTELVSRCVKLMMQRPMLERVASTSGQVNSWLTLR